MGMGKEGHRRAGACTSFATLSISPEMSFASL